MYVVNGDKGFDDFDKKFLDEHLDGKTPVVVALNKNRRRHERKRFSNSWKACSNTTKSKPSCPCPQRRARTWTK
ncbi:MAG: hypothetical protein L6V85_08725 [Clostridiales bacterium]|nr:MAG: hypothetical protein L6V85_08725 [Clostridiales bacterium]